jgi:hypothetical protein
VGVWIDHRRAVIVSMTNSGDSTRLILSSVETQLGRFGGRRSIAPFEAQLVPADDSKERRLHGHLAIFYDAVAAATRGAEALFVFGPGEAKVELRQRLARTRDAGRIVAFETIDAMTDRQIAAKVRQHFAAAPAANGARIRATPRGRRPQAAGSRAARA